jgi:hypothetical protein
MLWDCFVLEHKDGRTSGRSWSARPELSLAERETLLRWRDVVQGQFAVQRRDGSALIVVNLVDELTYRVRSNVGPSVFRRMPRRSFLITRLMPVGDEWMLSGADERAGALLIAAGDAAPWSCPFTSRAARARTALTPTSHVDTV